MKWLAVLVLAGCGGGGRPPECDFSNMPLHPDGPAEQIDDCRAFVIGVGEHLYVNMTVTGSEAVCTETLGEGLALNAEPIYSEFGEDGPRFTYDIVGEAATGGDRALVDIECDDGSYWRAEVVVE